MSSQQSPLFAIRNLQKSFSSREDRSLLSWFLGSDQYIHAVDDVSFDIRQGEILGVAGQSGCGKSTLGELLVALQTPTEGEIRFRGQNISEFSEHEIKEFRRDCQVIFQDPYEAMNPRYPVARTVMEPLVIHGIGDREERDARIMEALEEAGLTPPEKYLDNLPQELSGGERQRVCIARALVLDPDFIVADEPVSMLDVSVRTGILHLFKRLQRERNLTMMYVSHDLSTINYICDRSLIMYLGNAVEIGPTDQVIHDPAHPYTKALLESVPDTHPDRSRSGSDVKGEIPDPTNIPSGCRFHPRCKYATDECRASEPELEALGSSTNSPREVACYHPVSK